MSVNYRLQMRGLQAQMDAAARRGDQRAVTLLKPKLEEATRLAAIQGVDDPVESCPDHETEIARLTQQVRVLETEVRALRAVADLTSHHFPSLLGSATTTP